MEKLDKKIQQAIQDVTIPPPAESVKKRAIEEACLEFGQAKKSIKKIKGSDPASRLMGKIINVIKQFTGGSEMTTRKLAAAFGVAVIALTIGITLNQSQNNLLVKQNASVTDAPETAAVNRSVPTQVEQKAPLRETEDIVGSQAPQETIADLVEQEQPIAGRVVQKMPLAQTSVPASKMKRKGEIVGKQARAQFQKEMTVHSAATMQVEMDRPVGIMPPPSDAAGQDKFESFKQNKVSLVSEQPVSTFSVDVDSASYSFVRRQLNNGLLPQKDAVRVEELINYFDYDYTLPSDRSQPFLPSTAVYQTPWNEHTKLLHIGIKGYDIEPTEKPVSNLVFLLDVSGSMNSPDKLPLLKNSFRMLVESLKPEDTVSIAVYAGAAGVVLEPTKVSSKMKILAALNKLQAGGSTAGGAGIKLAYSLAEANFDASGVNRVILATDGDFNVGIRNQQELKGFIERKRASGIFLSVLGFGQGNYNDSLMQALAQNGNGNAAYIDTLSEARKVLVDEASSTLFPIANDVKIQVEFNPATVHDYRLIGYETRKLDRQDFNNDQIDAGDIGSGHTVTAIYEITPVDAKEKLVDSLRYQGNAVDVIPDKSKTTEYAFVKIRYKLPGQKASKLTSVAVGKQSEYLDLSKLPMDMQFAAAVAAFGQIIRNDPFMKDYSYKNVIELASPARGDDPFGYRSEFINLVRLAQTAQGM